VNHPAGEPKLLLEPSDGIPEVVAGPAALEGALRALKGGRGPVAVDAERASSYRYGQRAYLVQLRRQDSGTSLIDPVACPDLAPVGAVLQDTEWVLHAANQDLPCLAEVGMFPARLFDTELAGRLAGFPKVGLASLCAEVLGVTLEKGHSAADWSRRPLPDPWLRYAALDVEVLVALRDALAQLLEEQGKLEWAQEEFAAILATTPGAHAAPAEDRWRRTSGVHTVRGARGLAVVRSLWHARDRVARKRDLSPGRVLPDSAIVAAATVQPRTVGELVALPVFGGRANRRMAGTWLAAITEALDLPERELPTPRGNGEGLPPPARWPDRNPEAAARLAAAREALRSRAAQLGMPVENLVTPEFVRRLAWAPTEPLDPAAVAAALRDLGARPWQVDQVADVLAEALRTEA
jgi:ribonuclease D